MKKIFLLADGANPHTIKWVKSLAAFEFEIFLFSLNEFEENIYSDVTGLQTYRCNIPASIVSSNSGAIKKLKYLKYFLDLKRKLKQFKPDILHAHYASSYGLLGALTFFKVFLISVWGSDVYDFPNKSIFHKMIIRFNLSRAQLVLSTSKSMANVTAKLTQTEIKIIPFGVDTSVFTPTSITNKDEFSITIGITKSLESKYGINYLLEAFSIIKKRLPKYQLKLIIVGKGSKEKQLKELATKLDIQNDTEFTGWVPPDEIPSYYKLFDIAVFPSICEESFGVSVIEACASEVPVIVSSRGGLPEVVDHEITGLVVKSHCSQEIANAIDKLIANKNLREAMGRNGRKKVMTEYSWKKNLEEMIRIYHQV